MTGAAPGSEAAPWLAVEGLTVDWAPQGEPRRRAVDGVSFVLRRGETLGLVGESGSGKTTLVRALTRLLPEPPAHICGGRVLLEGVDLLGLDAAGLRAVRGRRIAYVFQHPASHLDPLQSVGAALREVLRLRRNLSGEQAAAEVPRLLARAGLSEPATLLARYPHQLSGGMQQRLALALALACEPQGLVADEPTASLDVVAAAAVLDQLDRLQQERGLALLLVSHDLGVIAERSDRVAVLLEGRIVEQGPTAAVLQRPAHPYTAALLAAARGRR